MSRTSSEPYSVYALAAAVIAGGCGAVALAVQSGAAAAGTVDEGTVLLLALVVCPTALAVVATALLQYSRSRPEGLLVWGLGIVALAAPGVWLVLSLSWRLVRASLYTS